MFYSAGRLSGRCRNVVLREGEGRTGTLRHATNTLLWLFVSDMHEARKPKERCRVLRGPNERA